MTAIILPTDVEEKLVARLNEAGEREIGGVLMGEQLEPGRFRIYDLTVQSRGGSISRFVRALAEALEGLKRFFERTSHEYSRFNYLGEWHSHPSFSVRPSPTDCEAMLDLVTDPEVGANFAVLLIVKLGPASALEGLATVFVDDGTAHRAELLVGSSS